MTGVATSARAALVCLALLSFGAGAAEPAKPSGPVRSLPNGLRPYPQQPEAAESRPQADGENPARRAVTRDDFYDPANPDLQHLQRYENAISGLPRDPNGFPDWMRALREGTIQPRAGLAPSSSMSVLDLDVLMKGTKEMPYVRFPHKSHTLWLDCSNCHPKPFEPRAGSTQIAMADIFRGKYCGMCHDRVAFVTFFACQRCHSVPQAPSPTSR